MSVRLYYAQAGPIDPLALVNENVAIWNRGNWHCYRVEYLEPLPKSHPLVFDPGALAAGATSGDTILPNLDQHFDPPAMAQLRFYPLEDVRVTFKIGQAEARFTTIRITATVDRFTQIEDPCLHTTEVLVLMNNTPYIDCANPTNYALTSSRVAFFGFRFSLFDLNVIAKTVAEAKSKVASPLTFVPSGSD